MAHEEDFEVEELGALDQMVEVHSDHVIVTLPEVPSFKVTDDALQLMFDYPDRFKDDSSGHALLAKLAPEIMRIRNQKRELYSEMGF